MTALLLSLFLTPAYAKTQPVTFEKNEMIRIALIDTGYNEYDVDKALPRLKLCRTGHFDFTTNTPGIHANGIHGTIVGTVLAQELGDLDYCVTIYTVWSSDGIRDADLGRALRQALADHADYVNYSIEGIMPITQEKYALQELGDAGVRVFVAAGNHHLDLDQTCKSYPTCYGLSNVLSTGALKGTEPAEYSNYGSVVDQWESGYGSCGAHHTDGTSNAAPRALANYVKRSLTH